MRFPCNLKSNPVSIQKIISNALEWKEIYESKTKIPIESDVKSNIMKQESPKVKRTLQPWTSTLTASNVSSAVSFNPSVMTNATTTTTKENPIDQQQEKQQVDLESQVEKLQIKLKKLKQRDQTLLETLQGIKTDLHSLKNENTPSHPIETVLNSISTVISTLQEDVSGWNSQNALIESLNQEKLEENSIILKQERKTILPLSLETPSSSPSSLQTAEKMVVGGIKAGLNGFNKVLQGFFDENNSTKPNSNSNDSSSSNVSKRLLEQVKQHSSINRTYSKEQTTVKSDVVNPIYQLDPSSHSASVKKSIYPPPPFKEEYDPLGAFKSLV